MTHAGEIRQKWIIRLFTLVAFAAILRLFQFSILEHDQWTDLVNAQIFREFRVEALRGRILSHDPSIILAESDAWVSIAADTHVIRTTHNDGRVARRLSTALNLPEEELLSKLHSSRNATWIKQNITPEEFAAVFKLQNHGLLPGIHFKREIKRSYPQHPHAASIVGFALGERETGFDPLGPYRNLHGIEGIESSYNRLLAGEMGVYIYRVNRFGTPELESFDEIKPIQRGNDLQISLDLGIQKIAQEEVTRAMIENKARAAMAIVMDPRDGAIRAAASVEYSQDLIDDPDRFTKLPANCWPDYLRRNLVAASVFEPGSVWKPIVMAVALENHVVKTTDSVEWREPVVLGGKAFMDWKKFGPSLKLGEVLTYSSNVGIINVSKKIFAALTNKQIADEFKKMGFGRRAPVDFPCRPIGKLPYQYWGIISIGAVAEGYELQVSLAQLAGFYCSIANGGNRVVPHFGHALLDPESGNPVKQLNNDPLERSMSESTQTFIRSAMMDCIDHGTGRKASLTDLGIIAAGKTATAKLLVNGSYGANKYRASFAGFFPAENPQYVIAISVEDPHAKGYYGGVVAAPIFNAIGMRILTELNGITGPFPPPVEVPDAKNL